MKKILSVFLLLFVAFLFQVSAHAQEEMMVLNVQGNASIIREGQSLPASVGMACQKGDILKTGADCLLDVSMNRLAGMRVLASSECEVVGANKEAMNLKVTSGNVILNLEKLPSDSTFQLETPTAIASVRGTQFWGRVDLQKMENPVTTFAVREGAIEVFAKSVGKSFTIEQGQALDIPKDETVVPSVRPALAGELAAMEQASSIKTSA